jgi:phosphate transport system permease protein
MSTLAPQPVRKVHRKGKDSVSSWPLRDRVAIYACWGAGLLLSSVALLLVGYMFYRGLQYISLELIFTNPAVGSSQADSGGFLSPIIGTLLLTTIGTVVAVPFAVGAAVWLVEYGRPTWLARSVESAIEVVAGTPSIVLAIFGLLLFSNKIFEPLSFAGDNGVVVGRSFLTAGTMMSLIAVPLIFTSTREALLQIPAQVREASYALGKTKWATIRRVLIPTVRPGIFTGTALGMGRIAGDTAIVVVLLGATLNLQPQGSGPIISTLRGSGSTLTSYVYNNSPAGEGNAPQKAYAAAFFLLILVLILNFGVDVVARRSKKEIT